jgi:hypothetical protein
VPGHLLHWHLLLEIGLLGLQHLLLLLSLLLHLEMAIEELVQENLNLTGLPQVGAKALQVNFHVV